jgi:hypothetical protein
MIQKSNLQTLFIATIITACLAVTVGCEKEKAEPSGGGNPQDSVVQKTLCDTVSFTYTTDVEPIIKANCSFSGCHGNGSQSGGVNLNSYANVVSEAQEAQFLGSIKHEAGFSRMPQGRSKLSDEQIETIECWIKQNTPE